MGQVSALTILLLLIICALAGLSYWLYARWKQTERTAAFSEQSRASRVRAEVARQVTIRHERFIRRYVHYFSNSTKRIDTLAGQLTKTYDLTTAQDIAWQIAEHSQELFQSIAILRDYSSLERGELPLKQENVSSRELLEEAIRAMREICKKRGHTITLDISGWQEKTIVIDKRKFIDMLSHVMHAIVLFHPEGASYTFKAESVRTGHGAFAAWMQLSDTSPGLSPEMLQNVFDPLSSPLRQAGGEMSALDMAFARQLAELMGGSMKFRSGADGTATEIEVFCDTAAEH